jgi:acetolactate synthase-1/2/3 large subunit
VKVADAVGAELGRLGVRFAFGVVGSGNFHVTSALIRQGVRYVAARHEGGAATMADAYARMTGTVAVLSVHQGCGLTNALTGITEAAKSRTPLLVLAGEASEPRSNFFVDQPALAAAVGAVSMRVDDAHHAIVTTVRAYETALHDRRTVLLNLPLAVQGENAPTDPADRHAQTPPAAPVAPAPEVDELARLMAAAERPVLIAGRGARGPQGRAALCRLAESAGALVATSAVAKGLFAREPFALDMAGGFATPVAVELIGDADVVVAFGCSLTMWTTGHGRLIAADARVVQVDLDPDAIGARHRVDLGIVGDAAATADAVHERLSALPVRIGYRTPDVLDRIAAAGRWRDVPYLDDSTNDRIDPRTLTIALDDLLPSERVVAVDSGNFMGYPSMFLSVPDEQGFCFTQAFQSIGLGLATAIGAALARPDRLPVAALGDGGALMSAADLETVARLGLPMVVVVYDDAAYGAEVHHFGGEGVDLSTVRFPPTDIANVARGYGFDAVTVRTPADLDGVRRWLAGAREKPLLVHAHITARPSWWLEDAFRGH